MWGAVNFLFLKRKCGNQPRFLTHPLTLPCLRPVALRTTMKGGVSLPPCLSPSFLPLSPSLFLPLSLSVSFSLPLSPSLPTLVLAGRRPPCVVRLAGRRTVFPQGLTTLTLHRERPTVSLLWAICFYRESANFGVCGRVLLA